MNAFVDSANALTADVLARIGTALWQWTAIAVIAAAVILCLRRAQPAVRFWLWNLLLLKLALMPFWIVAVEIAAANEPSPAADTRDQRNDLSVAGKTVAPPDTKLDVSSRPIATDGETPVASSGEAPAESAAPWSGLSWTTFLAAAWGLLIAALLLRTIQQRVRLRRFLSLAAPADDALRSRVADVAAELGLNDAPRVVLSPESGSPFVCGIRRPVLVLPASLAETLSAESFRQVVLHELAHLKRRDLLWCWPAEFVRIAFWFHPLVHWICRRIHLERELACDQVAMVHSGGSAGSYAQTLVDVVTHAGNESRNANSNSAQLLTVHP